VSCTKNMEFDSVFVFAIKLLMILVLLPNITSSCIKWILKHIVQNVKTGKIEKYRRSRRVIHTAQYCRMWLVMLRHYYIIGNGIIVKQARP
jgi:hypothetical protein